MPRSKPPPKQPPNKEPLHEQVRRGRDPEPEQEPRLERSPDTLIPTGCTLLDIGMSETVHGGWHLGTMGNLVGDKAAGKSILALTGLACCANDERFDDHRLIYDDTESAGNFENMGHLFGKQLAKRIEVPNPKSQLLGSSTIEGLRAGFCRALDIGKPFLYIVDSLDGLSSQAEIDRVYKATRKQIKLEDGGKDEDEGKKEKGSYKTERPRLLGEMLRVFYGDLKLTQSFLLVISQVRENLEPMSQQRYRRNGGKALDHYCQQINWLFYAGSSKSRHKRKVWGKERKIGSEVLARIDKNRLTGKKRQVNFDLLQDYGVDDVGALVDWLTHEKVWKGGGAARIKATDLGIEEVRSVLIDQILEDGLEGELAEIAASSWVQLEQECAVNRKKRFR